MPSPFPPIDDYAFLSDCHTGALVAQDGSVDWLCVPSFDSPSIFGTLLDREAGNFRLAPFGINVPASRVYEAGTNTLVTTWRTADGWVEVRDALTMGTRQGEDTVTPHTRPPADTTRITRWCARSCVSRAVSRSSSSANRCSTTGGRRQSGHSQAMTDTQPMRPAPA